MKNKIFVANPDEIGAVDGKVSITSEELAQAVQSGDVDLNGEEEADALAGVNAGCVNVGSC